MMEAPADTRRVADRQRGAASKIAELLAEDDSAGRYLRVYVSGGGCSGFQYGFAFERDRAAEDDACVIEEGGVALLVDPISLQYLNGARDRLRRRPRRLALRHPQPERHVDLRLRQFVFGLRGTRDGAIIVTEKAARHMPGRSQASRQGHAPEARGQDQRLFGHGLRAGVRRRRAGRRT